MYLQLPPLQNTRILFSFCVLATEVGVIHVSDLMQRALGFMTDPDPSLRCWLLLRSLVIRIQFKLPGLSAPAPSRLTLDAIRTIRSIIEAPYRASTLKRIHLEINFLYVQPSRETLVDEKDCAALSALLVDHGSTLHIKYNGMYVTVSLLDHTCIEILDP